MPGYMMVEARDDGPESEGRELIERAAAPGRVRLLVVDDEPALRRVLTRLLALEGWDVVGAENGAEALRLVRAGPAFDLILTDVNMPGTSGFDLARAIRSENLRVPILMMTGDAHDRSGIDQARVSGWIQKPFDVAEVQREVRAAIGKDALGTRDRATGGC